MPQDPLSMPPPSTFAARYVAFVEAYRRAILVVGAIVALVAAAVASTLPVYADFSYLLPQSAKSVRHLRALEKRAQVLGTVMVAVQGDDVALRHDTAAALRDAIVALGPEKVSSVTFDQRAGNTYAWENRYLFADLKSLERAKDRLSQALGAAKRSANPLVVDLDEDKAGPKAPSLGEDPAIDALIAKLGELDEKQQSPGDLVSKGLQLMIVQTPFSAGDTAKDRALLNDLNDLVAQAKQKAPTLTIGMAGDVITSYEEQQSILSGMLEATGVTLVLVLGALGLYYRSVFGMVALACSLFVGTLLTFMITKLTVGHLNVATAFLASIVLGNGINFGIMLLARQFEVMREGKQGSDALLAAVSGTVRGTFAAAMAATVAYFSLMTTTFRGFRDFGLIAGCGMLLCWVAAYTIMPALLSVGLSRGWLVAHKEPRLGRLLMSLLPRSSRITASIGFVTLIISLVATWHYLANDPYEQDLKNLRSDSAPLIAERHWMHAIDQAFGQGISGGFVIGTQKREQVAPTLAVLHAADKGKKDQDRLFSRVNALDDYIPKNQPEKLVLLADIRKLLSDSVIKKLPADQQDSVLALRPPKELHMVGDADVPVSLAWPYTELDGSRGRLVLAMSSFTFDLWNTKDIMRFADKVRALDLGDDVLLGGGAFVFADMLRLIAHDGPKATLAAAIAATLVVLLLLRASRYAVVTLVCVGLGTLSMLAIGAAMGLKVNFLDFIALPITLGIGIDYAVNICARAREEGPGRARRALGGAGAAVCLSSYTTIVGYGSLLLSSNRGIRSFGSAAILGEMTCLIAGLFLAPALLDLLHDFKTRRQKI